MKISQTLKLVFLLIIANKLQPVDQSISRKELKNSVKLYFLIKYYKNGVDDLKNTEKKVTELLTNGARSDINFAYETTALSIAQAKKMESIIALMKNEDPLKNVWDELKKRGIVRKQIPYHHRTVSSKQRLLELAKKNDAQYESGLKSKL